MNELPSRDCLLNRELLRQDLPYRDCLPVRDMELARDIF
jgi:hypothetical protein|nr:hypothetical protein Q903MT_gene703 [Picea sitchensis]